MLGAEVSTVTKSTRMARIRQQDTGPEVALRQDLWSRGLRYRVNLAVVGVRADIVFRSARVAVFVDGCFWHGCPDHYSKPRVNSAFWESKLMSNVERDIRQTAKLESAGWRVLRFWEHQVRNNLMEVTADVSRAALDASWRQGDALRVIATESVVVDNTDTFTRMKLVSLRLPAMVVYRVRRNGPKRRAVPDGRARL